MGKTVGIISDARLSGRSDLAVITERLLSISGEDAQAVERKHKTAVTGPLPIRFLILTNELPKLNDASGALAGRLIILRLTRSWFGKEDTGLTAKLLAELPGILLWAIEGWRQLNERGFFVQPKSALQLVCDVEDLASPIGAFIRECCVLCDETVSRSELFRRWQTWCEAVGRKEPGTNATFGRDLRAAPPSLEDKQEGTYPNKVRVYKGIRLRTPEDDMKDRDSEEEEARQGC